MTITVSRHCHRAILTHRLPGHFVVVDLGKYRFRPLIFK
jgi:hypothetical protein